MSVRIAILCLFSVLAGGMVAAREWAPDYMIIGAQKGGTTALYAFINQHPQTLGQRGEIHYFDTRFDRGLSWYKAQFPKKPKQGDYIIGDKSPYYLFHPLVPARVHKMFPKVKLLIVLRHPVDRSYSQYQMNRRNKVEKRSFEEAIAEEPSLIEGEVERLIHDPDYISSTHRRYAYLLRSCYVDQIKAWLKYFPREQIHIVDASRLRHHTQETLDEVFEFLGVKPFVVTNKDPDKHRDYPPMNPTTRKQLIGYFKPYNEALEALLNQKFNWN